MEGIVAKRTLKKSYYNNKNINNIDYTNYTFGKSKQNRKKEKGKAETLKEKMLFKMSIQAITVISIIAFVFAIKYFKISVVLESDFTKKIINYYNTSHSFEEIQLGTKAIAKSTYTFVKPIVPKSVENKIKELYKVITTKQESKEVNIYLDNNNEVEIYEESSVSNKENTVKENVGVSADINEQTEKVVAVSSSISSHSSIIDKIKETKVKFVKPVSGTITSHYGAREVIFEGIDSYHTGTDIAAKSGTKVVSSIEGNVTRAAYNKYNGNFVEVTNGKIETIYCHMSKLSVKVGDKVNAGTKIGEVGSTGLSTGPHLHFEIVYDGTKVDPEMILDL